VGRCKRQAESDRALEWCAGEIEGDNGNGANWDGEKCERDIERVIHLAGGCVEISKVEN